MLILDMGLRFPSGTIKNAGPTVELRTMLGLIGKKHDSMPKHPIVWLLPVGKDISQFNMGEVAA
jgi:hypothetical protein